MDYLCPARLDDLIAARAAGARVLAGGTDLYPLAGPNLTGAVVDLTGVAGLSGIADTGDGLRIGACTTWTALAEADLPPACHCLQQAARQIGGRQIQNAATLGGNLCNASPAADGVPPLLVLAAEVELAGPSGMRRMPLAAFLTGVRRTALGPGEVLAAVHLPKVSLAGTSAFEKLGARASLVISIAMVAVRLRRAGNLITEAAVAVGACSPVARRLPRVEAALLGPVAGAAGRIDPAVVAAALDPIDDVRATAAYRRRAAAELMRRAVERALA
jgi:CO/xanthine dehydrogenase FAD-binding subunit